MFYANNGELAIAYNEEGINSSGSLTKSLRNPPEKGNRRRAAEATILRISKDTNQPTGRVVRNVLKSFIPELQSFVQARGESPSEDLRKLAIQAALLRATEIGVTAKTLDTTDEDAQVIIDEAEQQHLEDNPNDTSGILPYEADAAISLIMYRLSKRLRKKGSSGNMSDFVTMLRKYVGASNFTNINHAFVADQFTGAANNSTGGFIFYDPAQEQEVTGGVTSTEDKNSFWDDLFGTIDKVVDGITTVTGAVNTTIGNVGNTAGGVIDQVTDIGGTIGAKSIDQYISENWLKILLFALALILFTVIIVRVGRNK